MFKLIIKVLLKSIATIIVVPLMSMIVVFSIINLSIVHLYDHSDLDKRFAKASYDDAINDIKNWFTRI